MSRPDRMLFLLLWGIGILIDSLRFIPQALALRPLSAVGLIAGSVAAMGLCVGIGLWAARRVGLGAPFLEAATRREKAPVPWRPVAATAALLGVAAGAVVLGLNQLLFRPMFLARYGSAATALFSASGQPPAWQGLIASLYSAVVEEFVFRLFLISLLVWLGSRIWRGAEGIPPEIIFWAAIVLVAILFGLSHVGNATRFVPFGPLVLSRALLLNGLAAIVLGWLYWRRGLEAAVIGHFTADLVLHVLAVAIG